MITTQDLMLLKQAVSSTALENGWDETKQEELFYEAVAELIKSKVKVDKKKKESA